VLDEKALRKPDWRPGVAVKLGDGQTWEMRKPLMRWVPIEQPDGAAKTRGRSHELGPELDEVVGVFFGDLESERFNFSDARFELAIRLLRANYNLTWENVGELLWISEDEDAENKEMWSQVSAVVAGRGPKPTPAT
jgi:hypothetical protein